MGQAVQRTYKNFLKWFLPLVLALLAAAYLLVNYQESSLRKKVAARENSTVTMEQAIIENNFSSYLSDAVFLAKLTADKLEQHIEKVALQEDIARAFKIFSASRRIYDQVRFIDRSGMEFVRINLTEAGPWIVPQEDLQNKGGRYYFEKGLRSKGEIYVSRFDLNMEAGRVEIPLKPMIRFSTPVLDGAGNIRGVIVLNYLGHHILDQLRRRSKQSEGHIFLVNPDGYWLIGPDPTLEWGFMFDEGKSKTISVQYSDEWEIIGSSAEGQFLSPQGLFTFQTVSSLSRKPGSSEEFKGEADETWKIISFVPSDRMIFQWRTAIYGTAFALLIVFGCVIWFWLKAKEREKAHLSALKESENRFRTVTNSVRDAIIMMDDSGMISFWNSAATDLFGYRHDEVIGRDLHALIAPEQMREKITSGLRQFKISGTGHVFEGINEFPARRKDGSEFIAEISVNYLEMKGEKFALGTVRDITKRKRAEEEIRLLNENLDERVRLRTAELEAANRELHTREAELRVNQERLSAAEERSRLILESAGEGVFGVDTEGQINFVNPSALASLGYTEEEMLGQKAHPIIHHSHADGSAYPVENCPMFKAFTDGTSHHVDDEVLWRKDGVFFHVEYASTPMVKDGNIVGAVITFRDITERKKLEDAISAERERLQTILDVSPIAVAISAKGEIRFANPRHLEMMGVGVGDKTPNLYVNPDERELIIEKLKTEGKRENYELQMYNRDRQVMDVLKTDLRITYEGEEGILVWMMDITDRKKAEQAIKESEERIKSILNSINTGIIVIDCEDRTIVDANPVAEKMIGLPKEKIMGNLCHKFICPREINDCPILDHNQAVDSADRVLLNAEGQEMPILKTVVKVSLGGKPHLVESFVDLTERKKAEAELQKNLEELEKFSQLTIGREEKMISLKEEINGLLAEMGKSSKYKIVE